MICPNCKITLPDAARFCGSCGMCLLKTTIPFSATHPEHNQKHPQYPPYTPYGYYYPPPYVQNPKVTIKSNMKKSNFTAFMMTLIGAFLIYSSFLLFPFYTIVMAIPAAILGIVGLVQGCKGRKEKLPYHLGSLIMGITTITVSLFAIVLSLVWIVILTSQLIV